MRKKSPLGIFVNVFLKSMLIIMVLFGVGIASYKLTTYYYKATDKEADPANEEVIRDIVDDVQIDTVSKNLIYHNNKETGEIEHLILEIFSMQTSNLNYITIPVNTQFAMSNELYQRIYTNNAEVPQIMILSQLGNYFKEKSKYAYGVLLLEDLLDIDISYYTVMENDSFNELFKDKENEQEFSQQETPSENQGIQQENQETQSDSQGMQKDSQEATKEKIQVFTDTLKNQIDSLKDQAEITSYIETCYNRIESNLTLKNKLKYTEAYALVEPDYIRFQGIPGEFEESHFLISVEEANALVKDLETKERYEISQAEEEEILGKGSIELRIRILNGSGVTGLAATYEKQLKEVGYNIVGIGNYQNSSQINTKIIVTKEGQGRDLLKFFQNAVLEIGELSETTDIEIILGKEDKIN